MAWLPGSFSYASGADLCYIVVGILVAITGGCLMPVFLSLFGDLMDAMNSPTAAHPIIWYTRMQLYFGVATFGCCLISTALLCMAAENQLKRIGHSYMASIMRQDMEWFDGQDSGKLAARISESMVAIRKGYGAKLAQMWFFLAMFFGGYIIALIRNWKISLVVSSCLPLMGLATMGFFWFFSRNDKLQRESYEESASILEETLLALRTVVSFGLESRTIDLFSRSLDSVRKQVLFSCIAIGGTFGAIFGVFYWSEALGFWYGAKLIADDITKYGIECFDLQNNKCMTGGTVLSVFFIVITSMFSIGQCAPCLGNLTEAMGCVNSLRKVIERQSKIVPNDINLPDFEQVTGDIELRNVKFHYPNRPDTSVYENLNLKIPAGKSIALVGESGCGKSTIVQLLERYYDITEGQLLVDGIELRERNLQSFRKYVALVSQEPRLFATSILENIRAGRTTASDEECYQAAKQANAHNFITEFPKKYHTFVGEGGGQLSGGQKQRIAIARAILRDPSILILDEATSALDNESEKIVQDALDKLVEMKKRTTIIIAHRLTTIRRADMIAVFEKKGQAQGSVIAELGTHDELMSIDNGIYRQLVQAQTLKNVEEAAEIAETIEDLPARSSSIANMVRKYSSRNSRSHSKTRFGSRLGSKFGSKNGSRLSRLGSKDEQDGAGGGGCFGIGTKKTTAAAAEEPMKVVPLSRQMKLLKEHPMLTLGAAVGAVCDGCAMPVYVILFGEFMGTFYKTDPSEIRDDASKFAIWLVVFGILAGTASLMRLGCMLSNSYYITELLRVRVVESFLHQEIGFFDNTKKAGGAYLADVVAADPKLVATNVCNNMVIIISTISALTAALIVGFIASPKLAGVAIATFVFMAPGAVLESQVTMSGDSSSLSEEDIARGEVDVDTTAYILLESMQNIKTVQAYSLQELMLDRYCKLLHEEMIQGYKRGAVTGAAWGLSQFLQFACQAVLMWYGARLVSNGELDTSGMMRGSLSLMMAAMSLGMNAMFAGDYGAAKKAASRLYELMDRSSRVDSRDASGQHILALKDSIDLEGIHFRYPMRIDQPVYNGVSFSIKSGETVALVGASGCGKSTAIQLIQRFYVLDNDVYFNAVGKPLKGEAGSGTIRVDNTPIDQLNVQAWRRCIGFVQQEPVLFTTSVKENIALGRFGEDVDQTDIENAAKMANAHNFIEQFEDRYDTNVGKRGGQLSGGQKQRVAIARALVRNPSVLILDEATSALDAESERVVQAALDQVIEQGGRTTIVIAHRLSTIRKANKIVVLLNDGNGSKVVEMGTHDELIRIQDGVYSRLAQLAM